MMRIWLLLASIITLEATHSFLRIRPPFWSSWPERVACNRYYFEDPYDLLFRSYLHISFFAGRSTDSSHTARYFLPFDKTNLLCGELGSSVVRDGSADVIASYLGVLTSTPPVAGDAIVTTLNQQTFASRVFFTPEQIFAGIGICYHYHFSKDLYKGWWLEIASPLLYVRNTMGLDEKILTRGGPGGNDPVTPPPPGYALNVTQAFALPTWSFGKIDGSKHKFGLADIEAKLGYTYAINDCWYWGSYWGAYIPTGTKPTNEFVFEPVIGYDQHWGIFMGGLYGYKFWQGPSGAYLTFDVETVGKLFFENIQERLLDPFTTQWGRYLWIYGSTITSKTSPGVNFFSRQVHVKPGTTRDLNLAFAYHQQGFSVEFGYHYYSAEAEILALVENTLPGSGVAGIWTSASTYSGGGITRDFSQINNYQGIANDSVANQNSFVPLAAEDLNLETGATPTTTTHTNYITFGYKARRWSVPITFSFGASVEYGKLPAAMDRFMGYGRLYFEF